MTERIIGRDKEVRILIEYLKKHRIIVITGERGIGKTTLMRLTKEILSRSGKKCYYIDHGSMFSEAMEHIFLPNKIPTGVSIGPIGISWISKEYLLERMEKSTEKIIFVEEAQEMKKEDIALIFKAVKTNSKLRFVLEVATPYLLDFPLKGEFYVVYRANRLSDRNIQKIVNDIASLRHDVQKEIVSISKGNPYIAKHLARICSAKESTDKMFDFLHKLKDETMKYTLDKIHWEILSTLNPDAKKVVKRLALAPPILTPELIEAFCVNIVDDIDMALVELVEREILIPVTLNEWIQFKLPNTVFGDENFKKFYQIYHPLFREYLRRIQPITFGRIDKIYLDVVNKLAGKVEFVILTYYVKDNFELFQELIKRIPHFDAINVIAIQLYTFGYLVHATEALKTLLKASSEVQDNMWKAVALGNLGVIYRTRGELGKALECHYNSLRLLRELTNNDKNIKREIATQLRNIGIIYRLLGNFDAALKYFKRALNIDMNLENCLEMTIDLKNMGVTYEHSGQLEKALMYLLQALELNEKFGSREEVAEDLRNIGLVYWAMGELSIAIAYVKMALSLDKKLERKEWIARDMTDIGLIYMYLGRLDRAVEYFNEAISISKELGLKEIIAANFGNLGYVYEQRGNLEKALYYYKKALKLDRNMGIKDWIAIDLRSIGDAYEAKGELQRALKYYKQALVLDREINAKKGIARDFRNIGNVLWKLGRYDESFDYLKKALGIFEELNMKLDIAQTLVYLGDFYLKKGDKRNALRHYRRARELSRGTFLLKHISDRLVKLQKYLN